MSGGVKSLGSGFPIGARATLLANDFPLESLVCYTFVIPLATAVAETGLPHAGQTVYGGSRTDGFYGYPNHKNKGFSMSKIRLFECSWHGKSCSSMKRFSVPTGSKRYIKTRRSDTHSQLEAEQRFFRQPVVFAFRNKQDCPLCKDVGNHRVPISKTNDLRCAVFKIKYNFAHSPSQSA